MAISAPYIVFPFGYERLQLLEADAILTGDFTGVTLPARWRRHHLIGAPYAVLARLYLRYQALYAAVATDFVVDRFAIGRQFVQMRHIKGASAEDPQAANDIARPKRKLVRRLSGIWRPSLALRHQPRLPFIWRLFIHYHRAAGRWQACARRAM